jgi:hypothetical protein
MAHALFQHLLLLITVLLTVSVLAMAAIVEVHVASTVTIPNVQVLDHYIKHVLFHLNVKVTTVLLIMNVLYHLMHLTVKLTQIVRVVYVNMEYVSLLSATQIMIVTLQMEHNIVE